MAGLFVFYLDERLGLGPGPAAERYSYFLALAYLAPLPGGLVADRGVVRACLLGAAAMATGFAALTLGTPVTTCLALAMLLLGSGLFKPGLSALVGEVYEAGDARREAAYRSFYVACNVGCIAAPLVGESLRRRYGWDAVCFAAAGGMFACVLVLALARAQLAPTASATRVQPADAVETAARAPRFSVIALLCTVSALFWMAFSQNGAALLFWARDAADRRLLGWELPAAYFASVPAVLVVLIAPLLPRAMRALRRRERRPSVSSQLALGMGALAAAYALLCAVQALAGVTGRPHALWLLVAMVAMAVSELWISSVGLATVSRLAPPRRTALVMGLWYLSIAIGNVLAGQVGRLWGALPPLRFFALLLVSSLATAVLIVSQRRRLRAAGL